MELVWLLICTKEGDILLAECQVDWGQRIERGKLARIDLPQLDMGHGEGVGRRFAFFPASLLHGGFLPLSCWLGHFYQDEVNHAGIGGDGRGVLEDDRDTLHPW